MNYSDTMREDKVLGFLKEFIQHLFEAICIILVFTLLLTTFFGFELYSVQSNSEYPYFQKGDLILTKEKDNYYVGDIAEFKYGSKMVTHRLVAILKVDGVEKYVMHGDNVGSLISKEEYEATYSKEYPSSGIVEWTVDRDYIESLRESGKKDSEIKTILASKDTQIVEKSQIVGKYICHFNGFGGIFEYIQNKNNLLMIILIVVGIYIVSYVVKNEKEIQLGDRLLWKTCKNQKYQ